MEEAAYSIFCTRPDEKWFRVTLPDGKVSDKIAYDKAAMAPEFLSLVKKSGARISLYRGPDGRLAIAKKHFNRIATDSGDVSGTIPQEADLKEGQFVELKTSIVFVPKERRPNIPKQLEINIMKEIAAFANTTGGTLFVGVDDKTRRFTGIEGDLREQLELRVPNPQPAGDEWHTYDATNDGYELIIREAVKIHLKRLSSGDFVHVSFWKGGESGRTVCRIDVDPFYSEKPLRLEPDQGYFVRCGNLAKHVSRDMVENFLSLARDRYRNRPSPFFRFAGRATLAFYSDGKAYFNGWRKTEARCLGLVRLPERLDVRTRCVAVYADGTAAGFDAADIVRGASPDGAELDSPLDSGNLVSVLQLDHDGIRGDDLWIVVRFSWQRVMAAFKSFQPMALLKDRWHFERVPFLPSEGMTIQSCDVVPDEDLKRFAGIVDPTIPHWYHGPEIEVRHQYPDYSWMHKPDSSDLGSLVSLVPPFAWSDFQDFLRTGAGVFCERSPQRCRIVECGRSAAGSLVFPNRASVRFEADVCRDLSNWTILDIPAEHRDTRVVFTFSDGSVFALQSTDLLRLIQNGSLQYCHKFEDGPSGEPVQLVSVLLGRPEDILVTILKSVGASGHDDEGRAYSMDEVALEEAGDAGGALSCSFSAEYRSVAEVPVLSGFPDEGENRSKWRRTFGRLYVFDAGILRKETLRGKSVEEWKKGRNRHDPRCPLAGIDIGAWSTYGKNPGLTIAAMHHDQ